MFLAMPKWALSNSKYMPPDGGADRGDASIENG
jgi:hypothetical protein